MGMDDAVSAVEEAGFQVTEEIEIGDLTGVKADTFTVPATKNVLMSVNKPSVRRILQQMGKDAPGESETNPCIKKLLSFESRIVDGIGDEGKFKNKPIFTDVVVWVDTSHEYYQAEKYQKETKPYLNDLKELMGALGYDLSAPPKINDEFLAEIQGRQFIANITAPQIRVPEKQEDGTTKWITTDERKNVLKGFRAA